MTKGPELLTVVQIAEKFSVPPSRIIYAIRTRRIASDRMAGSCRLFGKVAVGKIAAALGDIAARKAGGAS